VHSAEGTQPPVNPECGTRCGTNAGGASFLFAFFNCLFLSKTASCHALMEDTNLNFWGVIAVPVGVSICFGLALLVWLREELRADSEEDQKDSR
jgi:hypothetical protein